MNEDYIKYSLSQHLSELRLSRKIQEFQIKDNQIIINPYPKLIESDFIYVDLDFNLETEPLADIVDRIKITIDNKVKREYNRRTFSSKFPTDEQILTAADGEDKRRFIQGANWVLEFIKNSL